VTNLASALAANDRPSDIRTGEVSAVTSRGINVQVGTGLVEDAAHLTSYNPAVGDTVAMMLYNDSWIVLGRLLGPGTPTDYTAPGTGLGGTLLDGMVLTMSGAILATSATTGLAVTVPRSGVSVFHPTNHWIKIEVTYTYFSTVNGDIVETRLIETTSNTEVARVQYNQLAGSSWFVTTTFVVPPTFGGRKRTYGLQVVRGAGSGNCRLEDHSTRRGSMFAWDLGDTSMIRTV
jgi:hypothetical protein